MTGVSDGEESKKQNLQIPQFVVKSAWQHRTCFRVPSSTLLSTDFRQMVQALKIII